MRKPVSQRAGERIYADFKQAAALLDDDNLIWSSDLDSIRKDLSKYISDRAILGGANSPHLIQVVQSFIATENDLSIGD